MAFISDTYSGLIIATEVPQALHEFCTAVSERYEAYGATAPGYTKYGASSAKPAASDFYGQLHARIDPTGISEIIAELQDNIAALAPTSVTGDLPAQSRGLLGAGAPTLGLYPIYFPCQEKFLRSVRIQQTRECVRMWN